MKWQDIKYLGGFSIPVVLWFSMVSQGVWTFSALIYAFGLVPFIELWTPGTSENRSPESEAKAKQQSFFDWVIWALVPLQYYVLYLYVDGIAHDTSLTGWEILGRTLSMGTGAGAIGINVAHELGHRNNRFEQGLSKMLLLTSLYMHFFIEHNRGHHKYVSTPQDPATSRFGESVYAFWLRSVRDGFISAWRIEAQSLQKKNIAIFSLQNEMLQFIAIQILFTAAIGWIWGGFAMLGFIVSAIIGFLLLETVNYIEHYGLLRKEIQPGIYERVLPCHSWNSNHSFGRIVLFELTRHSDHHYLASRKYQVLRHFDESPQLPTGYPGMMLLSLMPPLWFAVMNPRVKSLQRLAPVSI